ncbi:MAG TPA: DUF1214 domain-containing protein [Sphingomonas sp.]|jgi:hypothetical protein|uniref:DUF1214 domain-containing protein n=1 Tax=Sphingomonas sp. TaxID=28214 RepID=UPI002ED88308
MRAGLRYAICAVGGVALGLGAAIQTVRAGAFGATERIGPWATGTDFGTADASPRTRAVVALRGLLALPAREARYYTAALDDAGRPLDGRCRYRITGTAPDARWWSLTLYDPDGYLVANNAKVYSIGSAALTTPELARWTVIAAPDRRPGRWLPTGGLDRFELTLRAYLPAGEGRANPPRAALPAIVREACA